MKRRPASSSKPGNIGAGLTNQRHIEVEGRCPGITPVSLDLLGKPKARSSAEVGLSEKYLVRREQISKHLGQNRMEGARRKL